MFLYILIHIALYMYLYTKVILMNVEQSIEQSISLPSRRIFFFPQDLHKGGSEHLQRLLQKDQKDSWSDSRSERLQTADCRSPWMRGQEVLFL